MALTAGTRLGPYEILASVGAGGMGEVYRAKDTRLDRTVAVKVLPAHLSRSEEVRQRFEREARTISSLSHPHICSLYDVGNQDGTEYLVMEFLEGETLTDRLSKGPLPIEQVLRYGTEIANALEKAHKQGIVHRDLKPGNIMLTKSGVKLVDFGLAFRRPLDAAGREQSAASQHPMAGNSQSAIQTMIGDPALTQEGTILGTFQYMAPEQLEGKEADARSDIFAFGTVLYEMATGQKAFAGKSQASLIASILSAEPQPISQIAPMAPPALDRVVKTCLAKDPDDRWQTAHDVALQLKWIAEGGSQLGVPAPVVARRKGRERLAWSIAAILALATLALAAALLTRPRAAARVVWSSLLPPEKTTYHFVGDNAGPPAVSPNGLQIAFTARDSSGKALLWVRALDSSAARALSGTEDAMYPFWSPDSRFLGFFAGGKLKRIEAAGGPSIVLCDAGDARGGAWSRDGVILFEPHFREPIFKVAANGGKAEPATKFDDSRKETTHRFPVFLPDGKHFLYLAGSHAVGTESELHSIYVGSLDGKPPRHLVNARSKPLYAAGHLLFVRQRTLMAQPFDAKSGTLSGEAFPIVANVQEDPGFFTAVFSVSDNGLLAYQESGGAGDQHQFTWFDHDGKQLPNPEAKGNLWFPRLSHDGRRLLFAQGDPGDVWLEDLSRHVTTRLTFNPSDDNSAVWSPDDTRIYFMSQRSGAGDIYQKAASGTGADELLFSSNSLKNPTSVSPDGRYLLYDALNPKTKWDVEALSLTDRKVIPFLHGEFDENEGEFSPDGHWVAYASNESGRYEIYVQPFPEPGGKWQVSTNGGSFPAWRRDGKELFYIAPDRKLMAVPVKTGEAFEPGTAAPLFEIRLRNDPTRHYDVSADGQRFLVNMPLGEETSSPPISLVQNWTALLRQGK
ncbi:MAG TPA: protein kinase [Thermoanaerobaculia bacterium]|nr:protein kinase [Thermoanaerobaculia bacterium]